MRPVPIESVGERIGEVGGGRIRPLGSHVLRTTEEENGRWARVMARAGERLARAEAVRWRNIVRGGAGGMRRGEGRME